MIRIHRCHLKKAVLVPAFLLLGSYLLPAQLLPGVEAPGITDPKDNDKNYIEYPKDRMSVRLYTINKYNVFRADIRSDSSKPLKYSPNAGWGLGLAVFYKTIGFWAGYSFPFLNPYGEDRGSTRRIDLQLNIYNRKFGIDAYLQMYKGYYIENTADVLPQQAASGNFVVRPDIHSVAMGINYIHVFNPRKFSLPSGFIQSEIQKKSAGSFVIKPSLSIYSLSADSSIFPDQYTSQPLGDHDYKRGTFASITISPGYIHNFVYHKFYLTLAFMPGIGLQYKDYSSQNENTIKSLGLTAGAMGRMAIGYNSRRYFMGVSAVADTYNIPLNDLLLQYRVGHVRLFAGYRFSEKKIFKTPRKKK